MVTLPHYLVLSALLLGAGVATMLLKRHALGILMGIELMVNAAALNFAAFQAYGPREARVGGQMFVLLIVVIAAAQVGLGVAIFLNYQRTCGSVDVDDVRDENEE